MPVRGGKPGKAYWRIHARMKPEKLGGPCRADRRGRHTRYETVDTRRGTGRIQPVLDTRGGLGSLQHQILGVQMSCPPCKELTWYQRRE